MSSKHLYIDPSSPVSKLPQEHIDSLTCHICLGLAVHPQQCGSCLNVFCEKQVEKLQEKLCPICRTEKWAPSISEATKNLFDGLVLACHQCKQEMPYPQFVPHLVEKHKVGVLAEPQQPKEPFYQFYFTDEEDIIEYDYLMNASMNMNRRKGVFQFSIGLYHIDLDSQVQTNSNTGFQRAIITIAPEHHFEQAYWFVERAENPTQAYPANLQTMIENAYQQFLKDASKKTVEFDIQGRNYQIDFQNMTQTNVDSGRERGVEREQL